MINHNQIDNEIKLEVAKNLIAQLFFAFADVDFEMLFKRSFALVFDDIENGEYTVGDLTSRIKTMTSLPDRYKLEIVQWVEDQFRY